MHNYYLIYNPPVANYLSQMSPTPEFYMLYGYYIAGCLREGERVVFSGPYDECRRIVASLCLFTMN